MTKRTDIHRRELSPQAQVMAQIADEDKPMPSDEDVERIAREHRLPGAEADTLVRLARALSKRAEGWELTLLPDPRSARSEWTRKQRSAC